MTQSYTLIETPSFFWKCTLLPPIAHSTLVSLIPLPCSELRPQGIPSSLLSAWVHLEDLKRNLFSIQHCALCPPWTSWAHECTQKPQSFIPLSFDNTPYTLLVSLERTTHLGSSNALPLSLRPTSRALPRSFLSLVECMSAPWNLEALSTSLLHSTPLHQKVSLSFPSALLNHEHKIFMKHVRIGYFLGQCFLSMSDCNYRYSKTTWQGCMERSGKEGSQRKHSRMKNTLESWWSNQPKRLHEIKAL